MVLASCASFPCHTEPRRVLSQVNGIPETVYPKDTILVGSEPNRYCQVVFEPAFATHHSVWFTDPPDGVAMARVLIANPDGPPTRLEARLPSNVAASLERGCRKFLTSAPRCANLGRDGVYFHAAHYVGDGYAMRTLWSPRVGTLDRQFVALVEALRDYVVGPEALRSVHYFRLLDLQIELDRAMGGK